MGGEMSRCKSDSPIMWQLQLAPPVMGGEIRVTEVLVVRIRHYFNWHRP